MLVQGKEYEFGNEITNTDFQLLVRVDHPDGGPVFEPIQESHMNLAEMEEVFAGTRWTYIRTTYEEISIFQACDDLTDVLNIEYYPDDDFTPVWITPKAYPREYRR